MLSPDAAKTEGSRLLRLLLGTFTVRQIARRLVTSHSTVARWANEAGKPSRPLRRTAEARLGIPFFAWDERARHPRRRRR